MLLTGVVAQARAGTKSNGRASPIRLFQFLKERFHGGSGLFFDAPSGLRRRFASFATQTYLSIACYHYGDLPAIASAHRHGNALRPQTDRFARAARASGPGSSMRRAAACSISTRSIRSTNMAWRPRCWNARSAIDVAGAREALIKGFKWVFGENQLGPFDAGARAWPEYSLANPQRRTDDEGAAHAARGRRTSVSGATSGLID